MPQDTIGNWAGNAKASGTNDAGSKIKVIRREQPKLSKGQKIMALSEKILPYLTKFFQGKRDLDGMVLQPAHLRGIALNMAEELIKKSEQ